MIYPSHFQEWTASCVSPDIVKTHVVSLSGDAAIEALLGPALEQVGGHGQQYVTAEVAQLLKRYQHVENGGWFISGLDPINNWEPMEWGQFKPDTPRPDPDKSGKIIKYETQPKTPTRAFFLGQKELWQQVQADPSIPIIITEGAKKTGAIQSLGYAAVGLPGVYSGYRSKDRLGNPINPHLIPDIEAVVVPSRPVILAFDQDSRQETKRKVDRALLNFGRLLTSRGCNVQIAEWNGANGKGADDLIKNLGPDAFHAAIQSALSLTQWEIRQRLENRLRIPANLQVRMADLATLDVNKIPRDGIIGVCSPKGTGKTKLIKNQIVGNTPAIAVGHRIALMRNLSSRLGLDYKGDLDKVNGEFISGAGYTRRIALCVDSLLSIDPLKYVGCDLILDEVCQVLRHLLDSDTCNRNGKRPAILARFRELMKVARRVIVADADLNDETLRYLKELRGQCSRLFLIRNDIKAQGYSVRFVTANDRSPIVADLLAEISTLEPGKTIFVATDSIRTSKTLKKHIEQLYPGKRVLLINSQTSGGEAEREFLQSPDTVLGRGDFDVIIVSPSMGTGISIEAEGIIQTVYGIFEGGSINDADAAQALARVREPVQRVVYCASTGSNFSKIARSTNPLEVKTQLRNRTAAVVSLTRTSLREDVIGQMSHDWQSDPHTNLWSKLTAEQNRSMIQFRSALEMRLRHEGHDVTIDSRKPDLHTKLLLKQHREMVKQQDALAVASAADLSLADILLLEQKESLTPEERNALNKHHVKEFYCLDEVTHADVLEDNEGSRRAELLGLEDLLTPGLAIDRTAKQLEKQASWNQGIIPWDVSGAELRRLTRKEIGLLDFLEELRQTPDKVWIRDDLSSYAKLARQRASLVKTALNFTITPEMSDTQIVHQLLRQVGIKIADSRSRRWPGYEGKLIRTYRLDRANWACVLTILERRRKRRENKQIQGIQPDTPPSQLHKNKGGVSESLQGMKTGEPLLNQGFEHSQIGAVTPPHRFLDMNWKEFNQSPPYHYQAEAG